MGVTGLWRLIEPAGKPVPVETLENKVIAVDISIWLHQMVKGYQDTKGAPLPNAHLMGLFQRLCKLLYFRIKPVFVFDGAFPELKKETIARRQNNKLKYNSESERLKRELALLLSKRTAIHSLLGKDISPKKASTLNEDNNDDIFKLPALPENKEETDSESDDEESSSSSIVDLHSVDIESDNFKSLPVKEKYDLLLELKETRKMNSWGKINELPKKSDNFSDFQLQRLLKRRKVQECLEETEKEMGDGGMSIAELESLLNEEGIDTKIESVATRRIASNNTTRFLLINDIKQALAEAKKKEHDNKPGPSKEPEVVSKEKSGKEELEDDLEKAIKMSLECANDPDKSNYTSKTDDSWTSVMTDSDYTEETDSEEGDGFVQSDMSCAKAYIMQYSDFTNKAIEKLVSTKTTTANKPAYPQVDKILEELSKEKSIIADKIDLSSDEECRTENLADKCININDSREEFVQVLEDKETDISVTQSSVIYVENREPDIVSLDTSVEENSEASNAISELNTTKDAINIPKPDIQSKKASNVLGHNNATELIDDSENATEIISESDSNDDEFEEVPEICSKKTVCQLTLNMDQPSDQDDIFADIFMEKKEDNKINLESKTELNKHDKAVEDVYIFNESEISKPKLKPIKEEIRNTKDSNSVHIIYSPSRTETKIDEVREPPLIAITENKIDAENDKAENIHHSSSNFEPKIGEQLIKEDNRKSSKEAEVINDLVLGDTGTKTGVTQKETATEKTAVSVEELNQMAEKVANAEQELIQEKGRLDRIGRNITEQMTKEAQELLQIFGIPYIVAPMEAEAQCAFLESANLTDGTITDDSDIWLFGGRTVYKNFFNQKKHVLQFLSERIEKSFNLTREQLVLLALLVGSDYTTGVDGIGPVTALEILASFPFNKKQFLNETTKQGRYQQVIAGLLEFKKWVRAGKRTDNINLKKKLRNVSLTEDFPSTRVVQAYMEPFVERSEEKFSWGELDITVLRDYTKAKFGWSQNKLDEIINPVLKRLQERKSQKTVHDYFKRKVEFQSLEEQMSKRVKAAVQMMGPVKVLSDGLQIENEDTIPSKKRKTTSKKATKSVIPGTSRICEDINVPNGTVVSSIINSKTGADIVIPKTQRFQEIIPQREKDKQSLLQNKMKAIELFRKTKIDRKKKPSKRKVILPKDKAELSESDSD